MKTKNATLSVIGVVLRVLICLLIMLGIYQGGMYFYDFGYQIFTDKPIAAEPGRDITVIINEGNGSRQIGKILEQNHLIKDANVFVVQEKLSEYAGEIKPGVYVLNTSMTTEKMIAVMSGHTEKLEEDEGQ